MAFWLRTQCIPQESDNDARHQQDDNTSINENVFQALLGLVILLHIVKLTLTLVALITYTDILNVIQVLLIVETVGIIMAFNVILQSSPAITLMLGPTVILHCH